MKTRQIESPILKSVINVSRMKIIEKFNPNETDEIIRKYQNLGFEADTDIDGDVCIFEVEEDN